MRIEDFRIILMPNGTKVLQVYSENGFGEWGWFCPDVWKYDEEIDKSEVDFFLDCTGERANYKHLIDKSLKE